MTAKIIEEVTGAERSQMASDDIIDQCVVPMINEALAIMEENKAQRASDIDIVWINGYGWPIDKGGVMYYADSLGAKRVVEVMERLAADDDTIRIAPKLYELLETGTRFVDVDTGGLKV